MTWLTLEQRTATVGEPAANRRSIIECVRRAVGEGIDLLVFPELITSGYTIDRRELERAAEPLDGPTAQLVAEELGETTSLVAYGFCESADGVLYNSVALVGADGPVLHYRKLHLFDLEHEVFAPGDLGLPVVATEHGILGVCVCYDLRFVEVLRLLSLRGAELVVVPAAWVDGYDASIPEGMPRQAEGVVAQANLNQVAVAAVSQVGVTTHGLTLLGGSLAVDAHGTIVAGPLSRTTETTRSLEIDLADARAARVRGDRIRPREDRRTDVYGLRYLGACW